MPTALFWETFCFSVDRVRITDIIHQFFYFFACLVKLMLNIEIDNYAMKEKNPSFVGSGPVETSKGAFIF